jgi:exodeoxyribonuclease V alpha subunit
MDTFTGTVERITYYNDENGYSVIKVTPDKKLPKDRTARDGTVAVVGTMPELGEGESAEFGGEWIRDPRFGMQMRVETVMPIAPTSEQGITRYLSSGIVRGIGPVTAEKIVRHFGIQTMEILNKEAHRLHEVPRLKASLADKLAVAWEEQKAVRQTMIYLQGFGVTSRMATRIYNEYGIETISKVKDDPYALADEVFLIGFIKADQIARSMGVEGNSPLRIRAGLLYALNQLASDGHTYAPRGMLTDKVVELLEIEETPELIKEHIDFQIFADNLRADTLTIDGDEINAIYLPKYHKAEVGATERLQIISNTTSIIIEAASKIKWDKYLAEIAKNNNVELTPQQQGAVKEALCSKVSVLTGGPGTGKTTTLQMAIAALEREGFKYALASPTGRAAKRLGEATGRTASTIHRMLGYSGQGFEYDEDYPLKVDMLIVDEASMIDLRLLNSLLRALLPETHLMLVGDIDQLPSVGAGNVLRDVIDSKIGHVTRLDVIFRQSEDSHIVTNAHRINQGQAPFMDNQSSDFYFFREEDPLQAAERVVDVVKNRIPEKFGFDPIRDVQVIAPMYRGSAGIDALNVELQAALNPNTRGRLAEKKLSGRLFRVGDKVMQTKNNYDIDVFNGDIGQIYGIDDNDNLLEVDMGGDLVDYDFMEVDQLTHAYCISIHKSQGSEYPVVVIPILTQHFMMLQRNLLYTAITRAKDMVVLVGNRQAVHLAVKNNKVSRRNSGLLSRLT